ncbi:hypothetical protein MTsPCn5_04930 [Croceitalea sp. MTPC5]|uniref:ATP-grasp domain-containing protein n=1 Tax=Croceitalea sp. MTPC5 TaxID=3056565 RepID=UPI002B3C9B51|nr:hypothetical protein MTsPCn5_04930 [Croceitalea sp. MTPC5]
MRFDITLLTEQKYIAPAKIDTYNTNIMLEDKLVFDALTEIGLKVNRVAWNDVDFDWNTTKFALFRTTWDYFDHLDAFSNWFVKTAKQTTFINSKDLIDWNIDKHYLRDLENKGIAIPNTLFMEPKEDLNLLQAIQKAKDSHGFNTDTFVLKPCIAAGARHTYKFHYSNWEKLNQTFKDLISQEALMLQEFQKNIVTKGEVSMMLFEGRFTHAVLKTAKKGDFRVQDDYGGAVHEYKVNQREISFAEKVIKACPELPLYARVDIFEDNSGEIVLAELELFEPELWFRLNTEAAKYFAKRLKERYFR